MPWLIEKALPPLARKWAGYEIQIASVESASWSQLELRGLQVREVGPSPALERFDAAYIKVSYGARLFLGQTDALREINGRSIAMEFAMQAAEEQETETTSSSFALPQGLPLVSIRDVSVKVQPLEGELIFVSEANLDILEDGAINLRGHHAERALELKALWKGQSLQNLLFTVEGKPLVRDSTIDVSRVMEGILHADLHLPVGESKNSLRADLQAGTLAWELSIEDLDLASLEPRMPVELQRSWAGTVQLTSKGQLALDNYLTGTMQLEFQCSGLSVDAWVLESGKGTLSAEGGVLIVEVLRLQQSAENFIELRDANLPLAGTNISNWLERAAGKLHVEALDLGQILEPLGALPQDAPDLVEHHLVLDASIDDARLSIIQGAIESSAGAIKLEAGELWLDKSDSPGVALELAGNADIPSMEAFGELFGRHDWRGETQGIIQVAGTWPDLKGEFNLQGEKLHLEGLSLGQVDVALQTTDSRGEIEILKLRSQSEFGELLTRLTLQIGMNEIGIDLHELLLSNASGGLKLQQPARIEIAGSTGKLSSIELAGEAGNLIVSGEWSANKIDLRTSVKEIHPEIFEAAFGTSWPSLETASFEANLQFDGDLLTFHSKGNLSQLNLERVGQFDMDWDVLYDGETLRLVSAEARGENQLLANVTGDLPLQLAPDFQWREGPLELNVNSTLPLGLISEDYEGQVNLAGGLRGSWEELSGRIEVQGEKIRLPAKFHPPDLDYGQLAGSLVLDEGIRCDELELHFGELLDMQLTAVIEAPLNVPSWIEDYETLADEALISANLVLDSLDLEKLGPLLSTYTESAEVLRSGKVAGSMQIKGSLLEPVASGHLDLLEGRMRLGGGLPTLGAMTGSLEFVDGKLEIPKLTGTLGSAPFELKGSINVAGATPLVNLELAGEDLLLFRNRSAKVRANTQLTINGPLDKMIASGRIELTNGRYVPATQFLDFSKGRATSGARGFQLFALREPPLRDMAFDIALVASESFEIKNTLIQGSMRPKLTLKGTGQVPILEGSVFLDRTYVKLPTTRLELSGGTVQFNPDNPFVPAVDVIGKARMLGYDIRAHITGDYDDTEIQLTSSPSLDQEQLILLLLTGRLPEDPDQTNSLATANTVALYLAQDTLARWFADDGLVNEDAILERFEFAFGNDVSKNGIETVDLAYRLTSKEGLPEDLRNYRHLYLNAQRDKYEDYNYGVRLVFRFR
ncbi:MAG: hypothetical protein ACI8X5_001750 [Planctomycetota bacterium]|jgi:hypothetical protein